MVEKNTNAVISEFYMSVTNVLKTTYELISVEKKVNHPNVVESNMSNPLPLQYEDSIHT